MAGRKACTRASTVEEVLWIIGGRERWDGSYVQQEARLDLVGVRVRY